jgi:hypothetical protein
MSLQQVKQLSHRLLHLTLRKVAAASQHPQRQSCRGKAGSKLEQHRTSAAHGLMSTAALAAPAGRLALACVQPLQRRPT